MDADRQPLSSPRRPSETRAGPARRSDARSTSLLRESLGAIASFGLAQFLNAAAGLVRIPLLVRALGSTGYGRLSVILAIWPWAALPGQAIKQSSRLRAAEGRRLHRSAGVPLLWVGPLGVACTAIAAFAVVPSDPTFRSIAVFSAIFALGLAAIIYALCAARVGELEATGRAAAVNAATASSAVLGLPAVACAIAVGLDDVFTMALISVVALSLPHASLLSVKRTDLLASIADPVSDRRLVRLQLSGTIASLLGAGADVILVGVIVGSDAAGVYAVAYKVLSLALLAPLGVQGVISARFGRLRATGLLSQFRYTLGRSTLVLGGYGLLAGGAIALFGPDFTAVLTSGAVERANGLYILLGLITLTGCTASPLLAAMSDSAGLTARNRVLAGAGMLNVGLSIPLAALVGLEGPAVATVGSNILILGFCIYWWRPSRGDLRYIHPVAR